MLLKNSVKVFDPIGELPRYVVLLHRKSYECGNVTSKDSVYPAKAIGKYGFWAGVGIPF